MIDPSPAGGSALAYDVVVPTIGRPSLARLLSSLERAEGPLPGAVFVVDDRRDRTLPLPLGHLARLADRVCIVTGAARGPAAARNRGWSCSRAPWVSFLDDDVEVSATWRGDLARDLAACEPADAASQGRVRVPLPRNRRPTDWERNVKGLEGARWITADCAYRRAVLAETGGFDERFPRAFREDADLALRVTALGATIAQGSREITHPVRPADAWVSVRLQAGNADDVLMRALHGDGWYERAGAPRGCYGTHLMTVAAACGAVACTAVWGGATLAFALRRIGPGPRDAREIATMLATSVAIPFAAVGHALRARLALRATLARGRRLPLLVLFDRDGTLIHDDPQLRDAQAVRPVTGAREALERLRAAGVAVGLVTNQPRIGSGKLAQAEAEAISRRLDALLGPFVGTFTCPHVPEDRCACRKPEPALIFDALERTGIPAAACVVVGDIGSDVEAARRAGVRAILVPTPVTRREEVAAAPVVARDLNAAVDLILAGAAS